MLIPLVDSLRCPRVHAETWLVASIDHAEDRDIITGFLGCPECLAEYQIRDGIVYFSTEVQQTPFMAPDEVEATRLAAALDLTDSRMTAALHGDWGAHAQLVRGMSPAHLLLINPPAGIVSGDGISIVIADTAPLAQSSMDAVAVDSSATDAMLASLDAALSGGKRMLGRASMPVPANYTELARDDAAWVARLDQKVTVSAPVMPTRRSR